MTNKLIIRESENTNLPRPNAEVFFCLKNGDVPFLISVLNARQLLVI